MYGVGFDAGDYDLGDIAADIDDDPGDDAPWEEPPDEVEEQANQPNPPNGEAAPKQPRLQQQPLEFAEQSGLRRIAAPIPRAEGDDVWDETHDVQVDDVDAGDGTQRALQHLVVATKSTRAEMGIQPWARGYALPDVRMHHVRLHEPKLRALDGSTTVTTESGDVIKYAPLKHGTTVLEYGKGAGKQDVVHDQIRDGPNRARLVPLQQA